MSYAEAKARYAAIGVDTEAAIARLKTVPISLHCWQGDDAVSYTHLMASKKRSTSASCSKLPLGFTLKNSFRSKANSCVSPSISTPC